MRKDIERKCENCTLYQARSTAGKKRIAPLQTINVGIRFSKVAADILGPVTRAETSGAKYILVLGDYFTKYAVCVPLEGTTTENVARAIVENWVLTFWAFDCLHTDQGSNFCSELLLEMCKIFGIEKTRTSPYHPKGNGMVEHHNRVNAISKYCANNPSSWDQMILYLNFVYSTTVHKTTGITPFLLVFGQECKYPIDLLLQKAPGHEFANYEFTTWLNEQFREPHMNARLTPGCEQERQKDMYQKNVFWEELKPGERVWLFAPHKSKSKNFFPWDGPYNIIEKTSEVNNKNSKDANAKKWQIAHYNRIKPVKDDERPPRMETKSSITKTCRTNGMQTTTRQWLTMETSKLSHQKFCRDHKGSTVHTNGWTKTKISSMTYLLKERTLQKLSPKKYTDGAEQWRARSTRNVSACTQRNLDNQRAQFQTPSSTTIQTQKGDERSQWRKMNTGYRDETNV